MQFQIKIDDKTLEFDSNLEGLVANGREYLSGKNGELIYDLTKDVKSSKVSVQMAANTSTLIPALRILSRPYNPYFDERDVVESQNNISFYWSLSKLAAYYNRFSTDQVDYSKREPLIRKAVKFLTSTANKLPLKDELPARMHDPVRLLGFYQGLPIFDTSTGFAKLLSRLGIHIEPESIMISTPLDKYQQDIFEISNQITSLTKVPHTKKKNRASFPKEPSILKLLGLSTQF